MEPADKAGLRPRPAPSVLLKKHRAIVLDLLAEHASLSAAMAPTRAGIARKVLFELERQARVDEEVLEVALGQPVATIGERAELRDLVMRHFEAPAAVQGRTLTDVADVLDQLAHRVERMERGIDGYASQVGEAMARRRDELRLTSTDHLAVEYRAPQALATC